MIRRSSAPASAALGWIGVRGKSEVQRAVDLWNLLHAEALSDALGEGAVDVREHAYHPLPNRHDLALAKFELQGLNDVFFLRVRLTVPEEQRLTEVIEELVAATSALFDALDRGGEGAESSVLRAGLEGTAAAERVRLV